jgi:preprotein translocase subunit YajC
VEGVKVALAGTILRIDDDSGKIEIRCGDRKLTLDREKVYFTKFNPQRRDDRAKTERDHEQDLGR